MAESVRPGSLAFNVVITAKSDPVDAWQRSLNDVKSWLRTTCVNICKGRPSF